MLPRWMRRTLFFGVVAFGAMVVATVAEPDACADVWTLEVHAMRPCCRTASRDRISGPRGDCCDFGVVEDRDPGASVPSVAVPPAQWVRVAIEQPSIARELAVIAETSIPERPPDRALRATVLLI